jgi:diguanylate cyclase (GGDEF)-like protein/PAS domain S-box-containing protein
MTTPTVRVLLTEDVASDAELEIRELKRAGLPIAHRVVDSERSFVEALREFAPDVILSDFAMPGFDGMAALALAREICPDTPFVFVSGTIGEEAAIRALKNGATDYVLKMNLVRLPAAVERALTEARERRERRRTEAELEIARERLTSIFTSLPDVLWSVAPHSRKFIYVSPAAQPIFGHAPEDFLAHPDLRIEVIDPEHRAIAEQAWSQLEQLGEFDIDYRIVRPDGALRWINDRGRLIRGADGQPERIDGLARDITEQVEHRRRIARLSRIREFSSSINSALVRLREREPLLAELCRIAVDVGGFTGAHVGLLDGATLELRWPASSGTGTRWRTGTASSVSAREDDDSGRGIIGRSLRTGEPAVWNDVAHEPGVRDRELLLANGIQALASFPLVVEARAMGVFCLDAREANFFDSDETRLLREVTANISFALELIAKQDQISFLALYDVLTGLPNRALFHERLTQAIDAARRSGNPLALAVFDLERFKAINDTLGQSTGDRVLQAVAQRLQRTAGDLNRVARLGSNVFAVMFQEISGAEEVARQLEQESAKFFGQPFVIEGRDISLAAKSGIAVYPEDGADADALFRNAEAALKRAKETGERYLFYAPHINARVSEQVELEHRLRKAVERGELFLHYQPKLDLVSGAVVGLEALMRWHGPDGLLVPPAKFVPVLEQTGLILEAGRQVIAAATAAYRGWQGRGLRPPRVAVNVSALQLRRKSFVADVRAALGDAGAGGGGVDLEVTESLLMSDVDESIRKLRQLRDLGLHVALDDFGTGYSSLAYLSKLPLDTLKIDRGFVRGMTENPDDTSIIAIIISLAQLLRLKVVAEGIETEQQAQLLRLLHCDQGQGYLFSPPVPAERIEGLLERL